MVDMQSSSPPYPDILLEDTAINDEIRYNVLTKQWTDVHTFQFPSSGGSKEKAFGSTSISDWSNLGKLVTRHVALKSHQSSLLATDNFSKISEGKAKDVLCKLSEGYDSVITKNRHILKCIIETIILCGNQGLALRGHSEDDGNFVRLLRYRSKDNALLREHMMRKESKSKYLSPEIQNEIIQICGEILVEDVVRDCNKSPCFGFIADEATDCSTIEQMALCVRFYDIERSVVREEFLGFGECGRTTGAALTDSFLQTLTDKGVVIQNMRGQGYDGAANMSGKYRGVQARVRQVVPEAVYTHCKAHNLNLCIIHACREPLVRNVMDIIQAIAFAFDYSAKRLAAFNEALSEDEVARNQMDKRSKLKTLCETRWASRADALFTFKSSFTTVCAALTTLAEDGDSKARAHLASISKFDFIITLVATEHILSGLVNLSALLQKKDCDLLVAAEESRVVKAMVNADRNNPAEWETLYESATEIARQIDVESSFPRVAQRQRNRPNIAANDASTYWRQNMYLPFIDHLSTELDERLLNAEPRFTAQHLLPRNLNKITDVQIDSIYDAYSGDLELTKEMFHREVQRWRFKWTEDADPQAPTNVADTITAAHPDLYPAIYRVLCVLISMPVSTATAERSFSVMRRVKTYLRNTMTPIDCLV